MHYLLTCDHFSSQNRFASFRDKWPITKFLKYVLHDPPYLNKLRYLPRCKNLCYLFFHSIVLQSWVLLRSWGITQAQILPATALTTGAIFRKKELQHSSLSGKNRTDSLDKNKLEYIKIRGTKYARIGVLSAKMLFIFL